MGYADDTTIYTVVPRPLLRQVIESLNQDSAIINSWSLKRHMRLNLKKKKSMVISLSRTIAPGYGDLTLGGAEPEEVKSLLTFGATLDSK